MRLIDADVVLQWYMKVFKGEIERKEKRFSMLDIDGNLNNIPTVDAVPTEFVMERCNLEFVCDALTDDGEWCSERCQYSEPQPECIHRYVDRIWRKQHAETD